MRISHLCVLLISAISSLPICAHADDAVLLVQSTDVISVAPKMGEESLVGKSVWLGNERGTRGSAMLQLKPNGQHDAILEKPFGSGLFLGYTTPARFTPIIAKVIDSGPAFDLVISKLAELGAANSQGIEVAQLAAIDLNADGRPVSIVSAHNKRNSDGTSPGNSGDTEAIFLIAELDGKLQIIDQIVDVLAADPAHADLPWIGLVALAENPVTGNLNLLVSEEHRKWEDATTTMQVTTGGKTTQQVTTDRFLYQHWKVSVYELKDGRLRPILRQWLLSL